VTSPASSGGPSPLRIGGLALIAVKLLNLPISETHAWNAFAGGILALAQ